MHAVDFLKQTPADVSPVAVISGGQRHLKQAVLAVLKKIVIDDDDTSLTKFVGKDVDLQSVTDELRTISMWSDRRLVGYVVPARPDAADDAAAETAGRQVHQWESLFDERWPFLFNSYYEGEGDRILRARRGQGNLQTARLVNPHHNRLYCPPMLKVTGGARDRQ